VDLSFRRMKSRVSGKAIPKRDCFAPHAMTGLALDGRNGRPQLVIAVNVK
jgi:hypothetical protein